MNRIRKPQTPAQKSRYALQRKEKRLNRTAEQRESDRVRKRLYYDRLTPEQREKYKLNSYATLAKLPPEEKERRRIMMKSRFDKLSPEARFKLDESRKEHYRRRQLRREQNYCAASFSCNEAPIGEQKFCLVHWCQSLRAAERRTRPAYTVKELVERWKAQDGKCAITGVAIVPGRTASIDHITPIARNGSQSIDNLRFIHYTVNRMKWDMPDEEFKAFIRAHIPKLIEWAKRV